MAKNPMSTFQSGSYNMDMTIGMCLPTPGLPAGERNESKNRKVRGSQSRPRKARMKLSSQGSPKIEKDQRVISENTCRSESEEEQMEQD